MCEDMAERVVNGEFNLAYANFVQARGVWVVNIIDSGETE